VPALPSRRMIRELLGAVLWRTLPLSPEILEPLGSHFGVSHRVLHRLGQGSAEALGVSTPSTPSRILPAWMDYPMALAAYWAAVENRPKDKSLR
jgi:hypothetical protein